MVERKDLGSWMGGVPSDPDYVAGADLGLPAEGSGSVAPFWRRPVSVVIDWGLCVAISALFFQYDATANLVLFVVVNLLFMSLFGATPGQFVMRVRILPVRGRMPMPLRAVVRTGLMLLLIPAVVWNKDAQPLHDTAAGTAAVTV
ncbi:RDD family protein [Brachybacterium sp. GCM10030267]|uniref:RDD family protein n=1 Tax=Brachybacterium sp. GCM10030267 TaxID=3273381 RepID=UPI00360E75B3